MVIVHWKNAFVDAEADFNEVLHQIHQVVASTAAATSAVSCGTGDGIENERSYLDMALQILELIQNDDQVGMSWSP